VPRTSVTEVLAREILRYFVRHPDAVADLEDIVRWRLLEQWVQRNVEETRPALDWLVSAGWLTVRATTGLQPLFMLNPDRRREAERIALQPDGSLT
jgi:hypothetical protein